VKVVSGAEELCWGINPNDKLMIAIFSDNVLDATRVDPESVVFAEAGAKRAGKKGRIHCRQEDSNYDGLPDLSCSIDVTELEGVRDDRGLVIEQGALIDVTAETYDGMRITGNEMLCGS